MNDDYAGIARLLLERASTRPFVVAIGGSVAAGKSTTARLLRTLLAESHGRPRVELVTTDGFLFPNRILEERGILQRKGFPESYDVPRLRRFLTDLRAGVSPLAVPLYSHLQYDVIAEVQTIAEPDIVIVEGVNILQLSELIDFSIYVDASEDDLLRWFLERFHTLRQTAFRDPQSFFHALAQMPDEEATALAVDVWNRINLVNLHENILATRELADLVVVKSGDHTIAKISSARS